jgi:hypothetical protein
MPYHPGTPIHDLLTEIHTILSEQIVKLLASFFPFRLEGSVGHDMA